ncbi:MAG TPA: hypothetical protein DCK95_04315 [Anaerolineaceae bacterium]|nr:hypothetical protein [Anaerolineaceae bacterium]
MNILHMLFEILIFPGFAFVLFTALFFHWLDRKLIARFQGRIGPPWYQPVADLIKLFSKEDILPVGTNEVFATLLPLVSFAFVMTASFYLPFAVPTTQSFEGDIIVVIFLLSMPSLLYFLAGWITSGVYSILGGNRSLLQYFSYEVLFLLAISGTVITSGSWSLAGIRSAQLTSGSYFLPQLLGFFLTVSGLIGKLKRDPYDIPKAKSEMVAGPLTEFSGKKLGLWQLTNQLQTVVGLSFLVHTYFGGYWQMGTVGGFFTFYLLLILLQCLLSAISAIYARFRIDQLIRLNWYALIPLALIHNLFLVLK